MMASQGKLPKSLIAMDVPFFPACANSKATRKPSLLILLKRHYASGVQKQLHPDIQDGKTSEIGS